MLRLEAEGQVLRGRFTAAAAPQGAEIEWCNRRVLARIHRLTLGRLRREIEPVNARDFMRFLYHWQHLKQGSQLHGPDGALHIIKQLQGYEISAAAWETDVLRRQSREILRQTCSISSASPAKSSGAGSHRIRPSTIRIAEATAPRVASGQRGPRRSRCFCGRTLPGCWKRPRTARIGDRAGCRINDRDCRTRPGRFSILLSRRGASFLADVVKDTRQLTSIVEDALWELAAAGLVTADGFENLRALIDPKRRLATARHHSRRARFVPGRWALLACTGVPPPLLSAALRSYGETGILADALPTETLEAVARQLLLRWGVVFRDLLARETITPPWRDLLVTFRRMEAQGEIRGGRFVSGFVGEQFARPEAVELLREIRRDQNVGAAPHVAAADPLNLGGIITPGPRVSPLSGVTVPLWEADDTNGVRNGVGSTPIFVECFQSGFIRLLV